MARFDTDVVIDLSGPDGNAFVVLGKMRRALQAAGATDAELGKFKSEATSSDYNHLLATCREWVHFDDLGWGEDDNDD